MKKFLILFLFFSSNTFGASWLGDYSSITYDLPEGWGKALSLTYDGDDLITFKHLNTNSTVTLKLGPWPEDMSDEGISKEELEHFKRKDLSETLLDVILEPFGNHALNKKKQQLKSLVKSGELYL